MRPSLLLLLCATACAGTSPDAADTATDIAAACVVDGDRPAGWDDATHANDVEPDYDLVFDRSVVQRVDITIAAADYAAMYAELAELTGFAFGAGGGMEGGGGEHTGDGPPEGDPGGGGDGGPSTALLSGDPSYVSSTVTVDGATWCGVGMRFKGNSSLMSSWAAGVGKLPFRLDFDRYEDTFPETDDQRFHGFAEVTFGNGQGDATLIRDVLASEILEDRGIPAARNAFWRVYLDAGDGPVYLGLYTASEDPSDALADRLWGDDDGNLYKPDGDCADLTCFDEASFEKKTNEDDADYADVAALVEALAADRTDAAAWRAGLLATLDVDGFLRWLAVNAAMENWDTYGALAHNYYLYGVPKDDGRLAWIPWDHNLALADGMSGSTDPLYADASEDWPLIRHLLDDATYAEAYRAYLADALTGAYAADRFEARGEALRALIEPSVIGEDGEVAGYTFVESVNAWDDAYDGGGGLYDHADTRREEVEAALGAR
ncbi:MAG: CotH kinase family protein [Pseudomonadota bacterium]|nr:CotH kinase family protein [Pseudomonadota bacterium]